MGERAGASAHAQLLIDRPQSGGLMGSKMPADGMFAARRNDRKLRHVPVAACAKCYISFASGRKGPHPGFLLRCSRQVVAAQRLHGLVRSWRKLVRAADEGAGFDLERKSRALASGPGTVAITMQDYYGRLSAGAVAGGRRWFVACS